MEGQLLCHCAARFPLGALSPSSIKAHLLTIHEPKCISRSPSAVMNILINDFVFCIHSQCISPEWLQVKLLFFLWVTRRIQYNSLLSVLSVGQLWLEQAPATEMKMRKLHCPAERKKHLKGILFRSLDFQLGGRHCTFSFSANELSEWFSQFSPAVDTWKLTFSTFLNLRL